MHKRRFRDIVSNSWSVSLLSAELETHERIVRDREVENVYQSNVIANLRHRFVKNRFYLTNLSFLGEIT